MVALVLASAMLRHMLIGFASSAEAARGVAPLLLALEASGLLLAAALLWRRGWTAACLGLRPSWQATFEGGLVAAAAALLTAALLFALRHTFPDMSMGPTPAATTSSAAVLAMTAVPLVEELVLGGYVVARLAPIAGLQAAVNVSVALRLLAHWPLGIAAVALAVPAAVVFAQWYAGTRRLWPLVVAHALLTFMALTPVG